MHPRLQAVLEGRPDNCILPFLWQRGEDEAVIREEITRVHEAGIGAVCVEARPHPDFAGPRWWHDMDVIMDEARRRGMRVWLLDDDHFPTGHAAGRLVGGPAELRRLFLKECHIDAVGPQAGAAFLLKPWTVDGDALVAAVAARRDPASTMLTGELLDVSARVSGDVLYWDVPAGTWRVFFLLATRTGGYRDEVDYVNPIAKESVRVLIDAVYEPHWERYRADFGRTFAGFFSDEPGFYNDKDGYDYASALGKKEVVLPWSGDMPSDLSRALGPGWATLLPMLWHDGGERTSSVRHAYMDTLSRLYAENFAGQVGDWCRAHGVEYIGHVLEDNGVHARLGIGAGHFFRSTWGQDMAGLDVVLWQIVPGFDRGPFTIQGADADGTFYHYGLAKLGSSLAHVDPKKKGRAMCEVFGAYGWREGLRLMKWITDHMLVRGVNVFVPHAFSQAAFPDPDCPPHFWARGKNPQFRHYLRLNDYTNRISHLLSGGTHVASVAVLYHAEAEWSGPAMPFEKPMAELMRAQVDADVVPVDVLVDGGRVADRRLRIADETYGCLVVPGAEAMPMRALRRLAALADEGLPLLFVDAAPARASEGAEGATLVARLRRHRRASVVPLSGLAAVVRRRGFFEVSTRDSAPWLRLYHVRHADMDAWMFFNEHPYDALETTITIPGDGPAVAYDAFTNQAIALEAVRRAGRTTFPLCLSAYQSMIVLAGHGVEGVQPRQRESPTREAMRITGPWTVSIADAEQYPSFTPWQTIDTVSDLAVPGALPTFSGTFRYETRFEWASAEGPGAVVLDLGQVYETAEVWLNGEHCGTHLCPPYRFEVGAPLRQGENTLTVEVTNTLGTSQRDYFSRFAAQDPSGLLGPVKLVEHRQ